MGLLDVAFIKTVGVGLLMFSSVLVSLPVVGAILADHGY
jgi:hypothetical protein